jgi:hypothetical protein
MKTPLLLCALLGLAFASQAQDWKNPLPLDSTSGFITYRGRFEAPTQSQ